MSALNMRSLPTLQADSGIRIDRAIRIGAQTNSGFRLIRPDRRNGREVWIPQSSQLQCCHKLLTLDAQQGGFMKALNTSLKGGSSPHPILMFALGAVTGMATGGAGFIFGVATLGLDLSKRDTDVLARRGDEIWAIEAIGKVHKNATIISSAAWQAKHITSYFLVDPYRASRNQEKGWLIHETRTDIVL